jgi:methylphosphotriester-DNA--protein-cysteine methyltransferase
METKQSLINKQMGLALKREIAGSPVTVEAIAETVNLSPAAMYRMWSKDVRDINITQITWMAGILGMTPQDLVADAVKRAGGMEEIMREARASIDDAAMSAGVDNVTPIRRPVSEWTTEEIEEYKGPKAAHPFEDEADQPED